MHSLIPLVLFSLLHSSHSIKLDNYSLALNPTQHSSLVWFGFQDGGELSLNVLITNNHSALTPAQCLSLYLCTPDSYQSPGDLSVKCTFVHPKTSQKDDLNYSTTISIYVTYLIVLENELNTTLNLSIDYELINPGGEQLSAGVLEIKYIMLGFSIAWGLFFGIWVAGWVCTSRKRPTLVQTLLVLNCVGWCGYSVVFHYYLADFSISGVSNPNWYLATRVTMYVCMACLFGLLELISNSISITKPHISKASVLKLLVILLIYCGWCILSEANFGDYVFYLLASILMLFLTMYLVDICRVLKDLVEIMEKMIDNGEEVIDSNIWHQVRMFRMYTISLLIFLSALACISGLYTFYQYIPWVGIGTHSYVVFIWVLVLSLYFRFQNSSPYSLADTSKV